MQADISELLRLYVCRGWHKGKIRFAKVKGWLTGPDMTQFTYIVREDKNGTKHFESVPIAETSQTLGGAHGRQKSRVLYRIRALEAELKKLNSDYERIMAAEPMDITKEENR